MWPDRPRLVGPASRRPISACTVRCVCVCVCVCACVCACVCVCVVCVCVCVQPRRFVTRCRGRGDTAVRSCRARWPHRGWAAIPWLGGHTMVGRPYHGWAATPWLGCHTMFGRPHHGLAAFRSTIVWFTRPAGGRKPAEPSAKYRIMIMMMII